MLARVAQSKGGLMDGHEHVKRVAKGVFSHFSLGHFLFRVFHFGE